WILGGEPSGHIICRDRTTTGDGTISALQVLAEMIETGKSLSELCGDINRYPQILVNVKLGDAKAADIMAAAKMKQAVTDAENELADTGRVLLRPSGTEPLIRVMVEGQDDAQVKRLANAIADVVKEIL
ncbi:MAG: phosphoglucosamine mutase, partial [Gammaproteobacteria bacterium]